MSNFFHTLNSSAVPGTEPRSVESSSLMRLYDEKEEITQRCSKHLSQTSLLCKAHQTYQGLCLRKLSHCHLLCSLFKELSKLFPFPFVSRTLKMKMPVSCCSTLRALPVLFSFRLILLCPHICLLEHLSQHILYSQGFSTHRAKSY